MSFTITPSRKAIAVAGVAFATALAGCGSSSSTSSTASNTNNANGAPQGTSPNGGRGFRGGGGFSMDTAALAKTLGVSETKLKAAIAAARPAGFGGGRPSGTTPNGGQGGPPNGGGAPGGQGGPPSGTTPTGAPGGTTPGGGAGFGARRTAMYAAIAKSLGLSTAKVQQAFEAQMPAGGAQGGAPTTSGSAASS